MENIKLVPEGTGFDIAGGLKLGTKVKYTGDTKKGINPFESEIIGIDLTSYAAGLNLVMIKYKYGQSKPSKSEFLKDNEFLQVVYCKDVNFIWADDTEWGVGLNV